MHTHWRYALALHKAMREMPSLLGILVKGDSKLTRDTCEMREGYCKRRIILNCDRLS
jgi:hypothetical protein